MLSFEAAVVVAVVSADVVKAVVRGGVRVSVRGWLACKVPLGQPSKIIAVSYEYMVEEPPIKNSMHSRALMHLLWSCGCATYALVFVLAACKLYSSDTQV